MGEVKCPRCGSTQVQLTSESSKHGCIWYVIWLVVFGWIYVIWTLIKWMIGLVVFFCIDWWMAIIKKAQGKGYVWKSKRWFALKKRTYYCQNCNYNFRG